MDERCFTLNTNLIPALNRNGISFRYIGGLYNPMTIIITHKHFDICRVDMNRDVGEGHNYDVYWFPTIVKNACRLRKQYFITQVLIDDIHRAIDFNFEGGDRIKEAIESAGEVYVVCGRGNGKIYSWRNEYQKEHDKFDIKDVIFNNPATIVLWADGTKTVVKAENEEFDPEKGLAMAIAKKALGNNYGYYDIFKKYVGRYEKKQKKGDK